jgi:hypothetical protein
MGENNGTISEIIVNKHGFYLSKTFETLVIFANFVAGKI